MALKSTVVKAELQISDLDRHYYATHNLTVAQHPSETDERLMVRLREWSAQGVDPQRVAQEVALMADKCAVDEELARLGSHIAQFDKCMTDGGEVGRRMDFLLQEMNREANTIGSKAADALIAQHVVALKCLLEKLREQVQNIV